MIWAYVVSCPCPCDLVPKRAIALPVGWILISAESKHLDPQNVVIFARPSPNNLSKAADANPHQFATFALFSLLFAQPFVINHVHRLLQRGMIITRIIFPASWRFVGELFRLDEVVHPIFGRINAKIVRHDVGQALNHVDRFRHAERAAIRNTPRWLVRVHGIKVDVRRLNVVAARTD